MAKKLYIKTWGCQMNEYDSSKIADLLHYTHGYNLTKEFDEADTLILNTCSIRDKAQLKVFHQLGRWRKLKIKNPKLIIGVGGCVASQEGLQISKKANYVDIIFGPQTIHRLPHMIDQVNINRKLVLDISFPKTEKFDYFPKPCAKGPTAFISIMEGCNKYCTFCIVPYTRGFEVSRPCNDIISEISHLSTQGVKEVTLLGQNVNAYRGVYLNGKICTFAELLRLVAAIDGIERIRFVTSHPNKFTDDIIDVYRTTPELVSFVHLPVQSGSDRILKKMKRSYSVLDYKNIITKLRKVRPNIQISSDFIIGFPGESKEDFRQTMELISDINFDMSFSFIYSARPGTPAAYMDDKTSEEDKKQRLYLLQNLINNQAMNWSRKMLGSIQNILVEGISRKNKSELYGRTENNRITNFKGSSKLIGKFINVKIIDVNPNSLKGKIVSE